MGNGQTLSWALFVQIEPRHPFAACSFPPAGTGVGPREGWKGSECGAPGGHLRKQVSQVIAANSNRQAIAARWMSSWVARIDVSSLLQGGGFSRCASECIPVSFSALHWLSLLRNASLYHVLYTGWINSRTCINDLIKLMTFCLFSILFFWNSLVH